MKVSNGLQFAGALLAGVLISYGMSSYLVNQYINDLTIKTKPVEKETVNTGSSIQVQPKAQSKKVTVTSPKKVVSVVDLGLCTELDNAYKANGVTAIANLLDAVDNSKFLSYKKAVNGVCTWHSDQLSASYNRYLAKKADEERGSGRFAPIPQTGSAVLAQNGVDPYEWQKAEAKKRDREQAAINWENGSKDVWETEQVERAIIAEEKAKCPSCRQGITPEGYHHDTGVFMGNSNTEK